VSLIEIDESDLHLRFEITPENEVKLLHFSALAFDPETVKEGQRAGFRPVEAELAGLDGPGERMGAKYASTAPGSSLKYRGHRDTRNAAGRKLEITTADAQTGLTVVSHYQFYDGIPAVRCWSEAENAGGQTQCLTYFSSFCLNGVEKEGVLPRADRMRLWIPHNSWQRELQWQDFTLEQLGLDRSQTNPGVSSSKAIAVTNTGNWSTKEFLPMGCLENRETGTALYWQIEHNGSWHWEIGDESGHLYLQLSGPTEKESHWFKNLAPGERFVSVPVCVGSCAGGFDEAMAELTRYRRAIRRPNKDDEKLPVIFNDYMNCLNGDPTTERELPLIDAAARAGCEYYVIDAGWYAAGFWWDNVGEWLPSAERFPGGFKKLLDTIRSKGMVPGAWLELEVMGVRCPKAAKVPDDWFFTLHGKKVRYRGRYQLDFRNPQVIAHADEVVDRLVKEYGVGYIKMDYNIEPGIGTDWKADSAGDGLLGHERAYLAWLDAVFARYPGLVVENCSSGGMRMDYAMLSRYSIQSTSDQEDYRHYATIAANAPSGVTPEQAAIWSYPLTDGDREEVVFNMVNAMLLRIHQSGHLANLTPERFALVQEGISCYKSIRGDLRRALPFWPLGPSRFSDPWACLGLRVPGKAYLAVWRRGSEEESRALPLPFLKGRGAKVRCIYPQQGADCACCWNADAGLLSVRLPRAYSARLFEISL
jgi:alpha-galactosidase